MYSGAEKTGQVGWASEQVGGWVTAWPEKLYRYTFAQNLKE